MTHTDQILGPNTRANVAWRISSYSASNGGSCVEAGALPDDTGRVAVRHSHHPDGLALVVGRSTWTTFIDGVKNHLLADNLRA
jgi:predicted secreted Zn-dependent protease